MDTGGDDEEDEHKDKTKQVLPD
jgi:WD40 repeat protein